MVNFSPYLEYYFSLDATLLYYYFWRPQCSTHTTAGFIPQSALPKFNNKHTRTTSQSENIKWSTPPWWLSLFHKKRNQNTIKHMQVYQATHKQVYLVIYIRNFTLLYIRNFILSYIRNFTLLYIYNFTLFLYTQFTLSYKYAITFLLILQPTIN